MLQDPATAADSALRPVLSVVVPVYNEAENISVIAERIAAQLRTLGTTTEIIFVDDGSRDATAAVVQRLSASDRQVRLVQLSRNFGHQAALVAGMTSARGDAVITLDGDLQHPPELIPALVAQWRDGVDVVQAIRRRPVDESWLKRSASGWFYRTLSAVSRIRVTPGASDYRLLSREALEAFLACRERARFNRGLVQWIGFPYAEVPYDAAPRHSGRSKYSFRRQLRLAGDAIFSFSSLPLRLAGLAGALVSLAAAAYLLFVVWARLFTDRTVEGWSSTLAAVLILGGANLTVLWILGEYVGRLYEEAKQRPIFVVRRTPPTQRSQESAALLAAEPTGRAQSNQAHTERA